MSLKITTQDNHYFTGIYFEWYCKISARSNKSILIKVFLPQNLPACQRDSKPKQADLTKWCN